LVRVKKAGRKNAFSFGQVASAFEQAGLHAAVLDLAARELSQRLLCNAALDRHIRRELVDLDLANLNLCGGEAQVWVS